MKDITEEKLDEAIRKVAEQVNKKRRQELFNIFRENSEFQQVVHEAKRLKQYNKGGKNMKKIASYPIEVDQFFNKIYGPDYYKDPDFFKNHASEWLVITD